jgi:hypothetical protein
LHITCMRIIKVTQVSDIKKGKNIGAFEWE